MRGVRGVLGVHGVHRVRQVRGACLRQFPFARGRVKNGRNFVGTGYALSAQMAKSHKDLICWQLAAKLRSLGLNYIRAGGANRDWDFRAQMRRAMRSACYQTSEGFYFFKHKPFAHYLDGAYASLGEVLDQIDDGHERGYFSPDQQVEMRRMARRAMKANRRLAEWLRTHPDPLNGGCRQTPAARCRVTERVPRGN